MSQLKNVRTRMAPSPTGELHIGGLRTALYDYALAKKFNGQFILRVEDTDQKRYVPGSEERLQAVFKEFGLNWDEGPGIGGPFSPYVQSQRLEIYQKYAQQLLTQKDAYYCFCSQERLDSLREEQKKAGKIPRYDQHCLSLSQDEIDQKLKDNQPFTIRLKVPSNKTIVFEDLVRGQVKFNTNDVDDQVLVKSNGIPTYHLASVIDDHLMEISHVIRAEEWLPSSPKHVLIYQALNWPLPKFAHVSVFLDPSHSGKMSKRHGSVHAQGFLDEGYLPQAVLNFIMLLGWNPGTDQEIFSLEEFIKSFELEKLNKKPAIFDRKKLDYFNGYYIRQLSNQSLLPYFKKFLPQASQAQLDVLIPILKERLVKFSDLPAQLNFLFEDPDYDSKLLYKRGNPKELILKMLQETKKLLSALADFSFENLQQSILQLIKDNNWSMGDYFMVLRVTICASSFTPPVVEMLPLLGKDKCLKKIDIAISKL